MITDRDHNKIWITPNVINEIGCSTLRDIHLGIEKVEVDHIQGERWVFAVWFGRENDV